MSRQRTRLWMLSFFSCAVTANLSWCQVPIPDEPADPAIDAKLTELESAFNENVEKDQLRLIAELTKVWEKTDKSQKKRFRGQLDRGLKHKNVKVKLAVFESLGFLRGGVKNREAKASTVSLVRAISILHLEKDNDLVILGLESLGRLQHVSGLTVLFDHLTHEETDIAVTAMTALANYDEDKVDHRKLIFRKVISSIPDDQADGAAGQGATDPDADPRYVKDRKLRIEAAADKTLARITNRSFKGKVEWSRWWSDEGEKLAKW